VKGLYVHVPFCVSKCAYCDFYSLLGRQDSIESYVQSVLREAGAYPPSFLRRDLKGELSRQNPSIQPPANEALEDFPSAADSRQSTYKKTSESAQTFQTLYLGGGTPSLLGPQNLTTLIHGLLVSPLAPCGRELERGVTSVVESTIEINPESAAPEFLQTVKNLGFNRLSFGVQSLSDCELKSVGRIHTSAQAVAAIKQAQKLGFKNISADLIIGLPGQTWTSLYASLETLVKMGIQHLSVYCLALEEGTPLAENPPADLPSDELQAHLFEETRAYLISKGFVHYEISNFALPGFACLHNLNYWRGGEYLGLGPAAASHLAGQRFKNYPNLDSYIADPTGQIEYIEELSKKEKAAEEAMLRLRLLKEGLDTIALAQKFGTDNVEDIITRLQKLSQEGLLVKDGSRFRLTPSRIMTSNPIFARVIAE
jgi:oxygen-independent coproporphyrinogen-3 oxidase